MRSCRNKPPRICEVWILIHKVLVFGQTRAAPYGCNFPKQYKQIGAELSGFLEYFFEDFPARIVVSWTADRLERAINREISVL